MAVQCEAGPGGRKTCTGADAGRTVLRTVAGDAGEAVDGGAATCLLEPARERSHSRGGTPEGREPMTGAHGSSADECVACERMVPQCDDLGLCPDCAAKLVVFGRNNPSPYTVNGRPLYVHLNGLAIVLLK